MVQSCSDSFVLECPAKYKIDYCESLDCGNHFIKLQFPSQREGQSKASLE